MLKFYRHGMKTSDAKRHLVKGGNIDAMPKFKV